MWAAIVPVLVKLILMWLGESEKTKEAKKAFLEFVGSIGHLVSVNLNENDRAQVDELRAMRENSNATTNT